MAKDIKTIRLQGNALELANELIEDFRKQGLRASWVSVVSSAVQLMHATMIDKNFKLISRAELGRNPRL